MILCQVNVVGAEVQYLHDWVNKKQKQSDFKPKMSESMIIENRKRLSAVTLDQHLCWSLHIHNVV